MQAGIWNRWLTLWVSTLLAVGGARAGALVDAPWLTQHRADPELVILDASPMHAAGHIPGAVPVDVMSTLAREATPAAMEQRMRAWGLKPESRVVIYDQGGAYFAPRLYFELYRLGFPPAQMAILDGGLAKWKESGGAVTKEPTAPPAKGTVQMRAPRDEVSTNLNEFLAASGDPAGNALVDALSPSYHYGETRFFDRAGHVPNATLWPSEDFFNADKTFKSPAEIRRMAAHLGVKPEQQVLAHCGGGGAAAVPFFALKFVADYPRVKLYSGSQMEWLRDERGLPFWTYSAPSLMREASWLNGWNARMLRMFGVTRLNIIDVRSPEAYALGHLPYSVNIPAAVFAQHAKTPEQLAALLGPAGIDATQEAIIVGSGGVSEDAALAFVMLDALGQQKLSILMESVDEWGLRGFQLTKQATLVGAPTSPQDLAVRPAVYPARTRPATATGGERVILATGKQAPQQPLTGRVIHVPYTELLNKDGTPKAAKDIWSLLSKAGLPRYAEISVVADQPGAAAVAYYLLKLMGFNEVRVLGKT